MVTKQSDSMIALAGALAQTEEALRNNKQALVDLGALQPTHSDSEKALKEAIEKVSLRKIQLESELVRLQRDYELAQIEFILGGGTLVTPAT